MRLQRKDDLITHVSGSFITSEHSVLNVLNDHNSIITAMLAFLTIQRRVFFVLDMWTDVFQIIVAELVDVRTLAILKVHTIPFANTVVSDDAKSGGENDA